MRIAVISPFLDRHHGTERCIIEQLERFPVEAGDEIHIYSQRVQDVHGVIRYKSGAAAAAGQNRFWHKVASLPGPHLFQYLFWFYANTISRWRSANSGVKSGLVYSPGINASSADAIAVHVVFQELYPLVFSKHRFRDTPARDWPRLIHRRLYYRLIMALEKKIYRRPDVSLAAVSVKVSKQLARHFQRQDVRVIHHGVDTEDFSVLRRSAARPEARKQLGLSGVDFILLLIGNDFKNKGLDALLRALAELRDLPWKLLVVGDDVRSGYEHVLRDLGIAARVLILQPLPDVLQFYAAADAYVGPSLEDAFGLPVLEAMACGLPVVCSAQAGVSEVVSNGLDGIILNDPQDAQEIASVLRSLMMDIALCKRLGAQGAITAREHSWNRNAVAAWEWLCEVDRKKNGPRQPTVKAV
ncbi:MAG: glycosyltransferase family 4 protein [Acidobacteriota bacterium]|nr:glycosyltransferase family 4 protein [Acidobacteriota bacterium]